MTMRALLLVAAMFIGTAAPARPVVRCTVC